MDLWQLTLIVLRRWYVFLPLCGLAYLGVVEAGESVQTEYQAEATVLLVGPSQSLPFDPTKTVRTNPYLQQGLTTTGQAMHAVMSSQDVRQAMIEEGGTGNYVVEASQRNPLLTVSITAASAEQASRTSTVFPALLTSELDKLQDNARAPVGQRVTVQSLTAGDSPLGVRTGLRKAQAVAAGLGLGLAAAAALAFEALMIALRRRRANAETRRRNGAHADVDAGGPEDAERHADGHGNVVPPATGRGVTAPYGRRPGDGSPSSPELPGKRSDEQPAARSGKRSDEQPAARSASPVASLRD